VISVQNAEDKDGTLGIRISSALQLVINLVTLPCFPSSTFPSSNFFSLRHIAHHIHLVPVYLQSQAMADTKGKGKEVEREESVAEGKLNSIPFLAVMQESPQGASCFLVASRRRCFCQASFFL
jgi:hypothetical protein